jgi:hypothetical protein
VNRGDKRTRRVRDRVFEKFERSRRDRYRYCCQEKKARRGRARDPVFRDPPTPRTSPDRCLRLETPPPPPPCSAYGTPTKRQVSKRQVLKRQVYKTSGLQNK